MQEIDASFLHRVAQSAGAPFDEDARQAFRRQRIDDVLWRNDPIRAARQTNFVEAGGAVRPHLRRRRKVVCADQDDPTRELEQPTVRRQPSRRIDYDARGRVAVHMADGQQRIVHNDGVHADNHRIH